MGATVAVRYRIAGLFTGVITKYCAETGKHTVVYEDGDVREELLFAKEHRILAMPHPAHHATSRVAEGQGAAMGAAGAAGAVVAAGAVDAAAAAAVPAAAVASSDHAASGESKGESKGEDGGAGDGAGVVKGDRPAIKEFEDWVTTSIANHTEVAEEVEAAIAALDKKSAKGSERLKELDTEMMRMNEEMESVDGIQNKIRKMRSDLKKAAKSLTKGQHEIAVVQRLAKTALSSKGKAAKCVTRLKRGNIVQLVELPPELKALQKAEADAAESGDEAATGGTEEGDEETAAMIAIAAAEGEEEEEEEEEDDSDDSDNSSGDSGSERDTGNSSTAAKRGKDSMLSADELALLELYRIVGGNDSFGVVTAVLGDGFDPQSTAHVLFADQILPCVVRIGQVTVTQQDAPPADAEADESATAAKAAAAASSENAGESKEEVEVSETKEPSADTPVHATFSPGQIVEVWVEVRFPLVYIMYPQVCVCVCAPVYMLLMSDLL